MSRKIILPIATLLLCSFFIACSDKDEMIDPGEASFKGDFVSAVHTTSGKASVNVAKTTLTLDDFKTDSGPDLNIYLASDITNITSDFIDLGNIKGIDGDYTHDLNALVDYADYKYVVVWCVAFNVNFGYATLIEQ